MAIYYHSPEGLADATVLTTANSGTGGTAFDSLVRTTTGSTVEVSSDHPSHGTVGFLPKPLASEQVEFRKDLTPGTTSAGFVHYVYLTAYPTATITIGQVRVSTGQKANLQITAPPSTTVAAGSNGVNTSTFAGAGTLNVASTTSTAFATTGTIYVATAGTTATITYTGKTSTTFTGCTTTAGGGVMSTGGAVDQNSAFRVQGTGTTLHTGQQLSLNTHYRAGVQADMGTTTSNGVLRFAYYTLDTDTPLGTGAFSSSTANTGVIGTDTQYTNVAHFRTSSVTTDTTDVYIGRTITLEGADAQSSLDDIIIPPTVVTDAGLIRVCTSIGPIVWE